MGNLTGENFVVFVFFVSERFREYLHLGRVRCQPRGEQHHMLSVFGLK